MPGQGSSRGSVRLWDHDPDAAGSGYYSSSEEDVSPAWTPPCAAREGDPVGHRRGSSTGASTPQPPPAGTPASQKLSWEQLERKGVSTVLREYYKARTALPQADVILAQMTNGGSRGRQKSDRKQSAWDKIFLAVLCAPLLPGDLGPVPLLHAACGMGAKAATVLSAALVYTAPIVIPLLVWNALGVDRGGILIQLGWTAVRVHSSSKPAAYLLLGLASAAIQAAQLARQSAQARRRLAAAIALTPAAACERSPALGEERFGGGGGGTTDGGSQQGSFLASGPPSTQGEADERGAVAAEPGPAPNQLQELLGEVSAIQKVLQGEDVAEAWAAAAQHSYRAVLFEVGRLCGEVGLQVPPSEADGDPVHLQSILQKLRAEMS